VALAAATLLLSLPAVAHAGDPILPLDQVRAGMQCTARTVIRGTDITTFDVAVVDVVQGAGEPQILVRVSGPAVDDTGIAEGFSGSPVYCDPGDGTSRVIGAIAHTTGDYGNKLVLVTPIGLMLEESAAPPATPRAVTRAVPARTLVAPLSFSGVRGPVATALQAAGRRTGRALYAAPAAPRGASFPVQPLVPGASVAVSLASGDMSAGAVGTVTYVDGDRIWAFGHPLDAAGRRALMLQDAYVYTVVGTPLDTSESTSYKLAAPGHTLGTLTNDAPDAVVGVLGAGPRTFPLRISATDADSGRVVRATSQIADENGVGLPTGTSALTQVAPVAVAQAIYDALRGSPSRQSSQMCVRIALAERPRPMAFCNRYVGGSPSAVGAPQASDLAAATALIDAYNFGVLHVTSVDVVITLHHDLRQALLLSARGPAHVRRGTAARIVVNAQRVRGERVRRAVRVYVPLELEPGVHVVRLAGPPADDTGDGSSASLTDTFTVAFDDAQDTGSGDDHGPRDVAALARAVAAIRRDDGLTASFRDPGGSDGTTPVPVLRDRTLRFSGAVRVKLRVTRR
jgi:hypothetical protein